MFLDFRPNGVRRASSRMPEGRMRGGHDFRISVFKKPGAHTRGAAGRPLAVREAAESAKTKKGPNRREKKRARGGFGGGRHAGSPKNRAARRTPGVACSRASVSRSELGRRKRRGFTREKVSADSATCQAAGRARLLVFFWFLP